MPSRRNRNRGLYLGRYLENGRARDEVHYPGSAHAVTIGPNGSGKGTGVIIPNLVAYPGSVFIIDPKGEAAAITYRARARRGKVVVINPFNVLADRLPHLKSNGFNPLAVLEPRTDNFPDDASGIAEALVRIEGSEPHWSASAQDLVAALIMWECMRASRERK
jgi:type IV secretion system protein VirD4